MSGMLVSLVVLEVLVSVLLQLALTTTLTLVYLHVDQHLVDEVARHSN